MIMDTSTWATLERNTYFCTEARPHMDTRLDHAHHFHPLWILLWHWRHQPWTWPSLKSKIAFYLTTKWNTLSHSFIFFRSIPTQNGFYLSLGRTLCFLAMTFQPSAPIPPVVTKNRICVLLTTKQEFNTKKKTILYIILVFSLTSS